MKSIIIQLIEKRIIRFRKIYILNSETKIRGGVAERHLLRNIRQKGILGEKIKVVNSMLIDWRMGFIKKPLSDELDKFQKMSRNEKSSTLPWSVIHGIQKKYWDEGNI